MSELKAIHQQIEQLRVEASVDLSLVDPRVRGMAEARARQAGEALQEAKKRYREAAVRNSAILLVSGANSQDFGLLAAEHFSAVSVDWQRIEDEIVTAIRARGGNMELYGTYEHGILTGYLLDQKVRLGVQTMPYPQPNGPAFNALYKPTSDAVLEVLLNNFGWELHATFARLAVAEAAERAEFVGNTIPVVLYNFKGALPGHILPGFTFSVKTEGPVTQELVAEAFADAKAALTGKPRAPKKEKKLKPESAQTENKEEQEEKKEETNEQQ